LSNFQNREELLCGIKQLGDSLNKVAVFIYNYTI